ncbi:hypothetical protein RvY_01510 [Ramazzottius varieornatus]|uniref:Ras-GEF domain-containing protein n=1 Tax=Ramazzottius varieornatus TaxID=947166 RepID=A0A1D1UMM4_RAMVA|nr:hypothetical protein RvY_01510 [Ramazzottius varieornatus]
MASLQNRRRHSSQAARRSSTFLGCMGGGGAHSSTMPRKLHLSSLARKNSVVFHNDCDDNEDTYPDGSDTCSSKECSDVLDAIVDKSDASVLRWKVEELAAHLTLITQEIFQELQPHDLKSLKWYNARLKNEPESVRVNEITRRFNYDGQWTVKEILNCETPRQRADLMSHLVRVAKRLFELNNFHSSYAIFSALKSAPLARLSHTMALLPKKDRSTIDELDAVFNPENNWQAFRDYQESAGFPRIPHIGFYKTDLIHAYHAYLNPAERERRMAVIEQRVFDLFNRSNYGFLEVNNELYNYLKSLRYLDELQRFVDEENIKRSRALEPDAVEKGKGSTKGSKMNDESFPKQRHSQVDPTEDDGLDDNSTNLIDDSHIEEPMRLPSLSLPSSTKHSLRHSQCSSIGRSSFLGIDALQHHFSWQGPVERKSVVRDGRFQYFPRWKRVWMAVWGTNLVTFKPKNPFRASLREHFQTLPSSIHPLSKWKLITSTALEAIEKGRTSALLEFTLVAPDSATVLKLKTANVTEYREWIKFVRGAINQAENPSNLINLDS